MPVEIERKFLVLGADWKADSKEDAVAVEIRQGYLSVTPERIVRVRSEGSRGWIAVKGLTAGIERLEFEYEIPLVDAARMLDALCVRPVLHKTRYAIGVAGHVWHVDEFHDENAGLVTAEVELQTRDESFVRPPWAGREVSGEPRYFNSNLVQHPFRTWRGADAPAPASPSPTPDMPS